MTKGQTMMYKTLHRKLKIKQHELHQKVGMNSDVQGGLAVHAPLVTPVMLLLKDMIITYVDVNPTHIIISKIVPCNG